MPWLSLLRFLTTTHTHTTHDSCSVKLTLLRFQLEFTLENVTPEETFEVTTQSTHTAQYGAVQMMMFSSKVLRNAELRPKWDAQCEELSSRLCTTHAHIQTQPHTNYATWLCL